MGWTKEQQAAIDRRKANILVSAAAGSGKTAILTQRVINRVVGSAYEEPTDIDRFLIVTYTNAAAMEMKERIAGKLLEKIQELESIENPYPEDKRQIAYLEKQLSLLQTASISTIHSFCLKTIKSYFHVLDIDPNIQVASEAELKIMQLEILENLIEEKFIEGDQDFLEVAQLYGNIDGMDNLTRMILDLNTFSKSTVFPYEWLRQHANKLCASYNSLEETPWAQAIKDDIMGKIEDLITVYEYGIFLCDHPNAPEVYKNTLESDLKYLLEAKETCTLDDLCRVIKNITFERMKSVKKEDCDPEIQKLIKSYRELGKKVITNIKKELELISEEHTLLHIAQSGQVIKTIVELVIEFDQRFQEAKREQGIADYSDLEHLCLQLLIRKETDAEGHEKLVYTDIAQELRNYYKEIYIDEYQDINNVQETILQAIAGTDKEMEPTRFMVGDMKQSIYRFRLANPLIFSEKYESWKKWGENEPQNDEKNICIELSQNFRSRENIINGVNDVFEQIMSKRVGDIEYTFSAQLKTGNLYDQGNIEGRQIADSIQVCLVQTGIESMQSEEEEESAETLELSNIEAEAAMVADIIDKLLKGEGNPSHVFDRELGDYRRVEARDIVILLRSVQEKANIFEQALENKGIGVYTEVKNPFFEALEIKTMFSLLKIIDNPIQDIPLITVLRSPIVGISYDELVRIRMTRDGSFYEALSEYVKVEDASYAVKNFFDQLMKYREMSSYLSLEEMISKLMVETGYYHYVGMLPTGERKKANLRMLRKYAREFEENTGGRLFNFIQYMDKLEESEVTLEEATLMGENENLIRIMTIHKSKGLEFPIVILCNTDKKFNTADIKKDILVHHDLGLASDYTDTEANMRYKTLPQLAIKNKILSENVSEEMRVLYVAMTRAKEKLIITGMVKNIENTVKGWSIFGNRDGKSVLPLGIKQKATYLDWIGMSLFAHSQIDTIRQIAGQTPEYLFEGKGKWDFTVINKEDVLMEMSQETHTIEGYLSILEKWDDQQTYGPVKEEIYRRLNFKYVYQKSTTLPTKLSVTQIKNAGEDKVFFMEHEPKDQDKNEADYKRPFFAAPEQEKTGAYKGTLIHSIFQHLDFIKYSSEEMIQEQLITLVKESKIMEEAVNLVDMERLISFSNSDVVIRMRKAKYAFKEKQFMYLMKASEIDLNYPENEEILIQGIIDAFFIEEDGIVIIDYKTDYINEHHMQESIQKIKGKYQRQLELYAKALSAITKMLVKEKYIYLYSIDQWISL